MSPTTKFDQNMSERRRNNQHRQQLIIYLQRI